VGLTFKQLVTELAREDVTLSPAELREMIRRFQNEPDAGKAHDGWKRIEKEIFGVDYND